MIDTELTDGKLDEQIPAPNKKLWVQKHQPSFPWRQAVVISGGGKSLGELIVHHV